MNLHQAEYHAIDANHIPLDMVKPGPVLVAYLPQSERPCNSDKFRSWIAWRTPVAVRDCRKRLVACQNGRREV
jgi:hypothetical protein